MAKDPFDHATIIEALKGPGMDTRQWCSFGVVSPEAPDAKSVDFDAQHGPLVNVTLQPSGVDFVCRVAGAVAGVGEAEYFPFIAGDEVAVLVMEGDERAGGVILGRLTNELDVFPMSVAGMDVTKNNFSFRRQRPPYVLESAGSILLRQASTGAYVTISDSGGITISDGDKSFFAVNADVIGWQNPDADMMIKGDVADKTIQILAPSNIQISAAGASPFFHAMGVENEVVMLQALLTSFMTEFLVVVAAQPSPMNGPGFAAALTAAFNPAGITSILNLAIAAAAGLPVTPYVATLTAALTTPQDPTGQVPNVGSVGLLIG